MASNYQRVNGRGHRTLSQKARCECCETVYTDWKFIAKDSKCYLCHDVNELDQQAMIKFIQENQEA